MKILLVNGSSHRNGSTYNSLCEAEKILKAEGFETEIFQVGSDGIPGCIGCSACFKAKSGKCMYRDDTVNILIEKAESCDGFIFGTPVHYAAASGNITSLLDRAFYAGGSSFRYKPAASVVCCRRGGASAAFDQLNKYFTINQMPIVSSQYWNSVHGAKGDEVFEDAEGMQTMRTLAYNMSWLIKCIALGKENGIVPKSEDKKERTNFIR